MNKKLQDAGFAGQLVLIQQILSSHLANAQALSDIFTSHVSRAG
jgi:hypothetical protein